MIGDPPIKGLVWERDRSRWTFWCQASRQCGRRQGYAPADQGGGIDRVGAEHFGWRMIGGVWHCPFCTGNMNNLRKLIQGSEEPDV